MIEIDGSYREGGGQILRTALGLSCLFQKPFRIFNIRKQRRKPGLMPQHLACVRAAQMLSGADVTGDFPGSTALVFSPAEQTPGEISFDIGTAGSTSLVLQTLIPAVLFAKQKTVISLRGGTHVPFSPCFHYLQGTFARYLEMIGIHCNLSIESYGFYPKGGGTILAEISPVELIKPLRIIRRGSMKKLRICSGVGNLPLTIAERQRDALLERLSFHINAHQCDVEFELLSVQTSGQGTFLYLQSETENSTAGFTALGAKGKRAEEVGEEAAKEFIQYSTTGAALDSHMSDQIAVYLSLCREESVFTTSEITEHLITNLWIISKFHDYQYAIDGEAGKQGTISIHSS